MPRNISLEKFIEIAHKEVEAFAENWRKKNAEDKAAGVAAKDNNWPMAMPENEWHEQQMIWQTTTQP